MPTQNLYQQLVLLSRKKHRNLRFTPPKDARFTEGLNSVPVNGPEFLPASRELPILFGKDAKDNYFPLALLSLSNDGHLLLDEHGVWDAAVYMPAFIRRYPFVLSPRGGVLVDTKAPHFASKETGKPLVTEEGEFTPVLKAAMTFLTRFEKQQAATRAYATACRDAGLLKPCDMKVRQGKGKALSLDNLYMIDAAKLAKLSDEQVVEWHRKGWLAWSYSHLNSLASLQRLLQRHKKHDQSRAGA